MATTAIIKIEGINFAKVYKHYDGDSKGTLEWLETFNQDFAERRGVDPEYKFAQLLRSSATQAEKYGLDQSTTTGWGVISADEKWYCDVEYTLLDDGRVIKTKG
jgi:hypothetical protein